MKIGLTSRQNSFVKHVVAGNSGARAAVLSGYSKRSARFTASKLLTNHNVLQHIEELFDRSGLSDQALINRLRSAIDSGLTKKANNSDSIKGLKLAFELKGKLVKQIQIEATQEDEIRMQLSSMSKEELEDHLEETTKKTLEYIQRIRQRRLEKGKINGDGSKLLTALPVKDNLSEPEVLEPTQAEVIPQSRDTSIKRAIGVPVEAKPAIQPTVKSTVDSDLSEDNVFHQKVNYPA